MGALEVNKSDDKEQEVSDQDTDKSDTDMTKV